MDCKRFFVNCLFLAVFILGIAEIACRIRANERPIKDSPNPMFSDDRVVSFP